MSSSSPAAAAGRVRNASHLLNLAQPTDKQVIEDDQNTLPLHPSLSPSLSSSFPCFSPSLPLPLPHLPSPSFEPNIVLLFLLVNAFLERLTFLRLVVPSLALSYFQTTTDKHSNAPLDQMRLAAPGPVLPLVHTYRPHCFEVGICVMMLSIATRPSHE